MIMNDNTSNHEYSPADDLSSSSSSTGRYISPDFTNDQWTSPGEYFNVDDLEMDSLFLDCETSPTSTIQDLLQLPQHYTKCLYRINEMHVQASTW